MNRDPYCIGNDYQPWPDRQREARQAARKEFWRELPAWLLIVGGGIVLAVGVAA